MSYMRCLLVTEEHITLVIPKIASVGLMARGSHGYDGLTCEIACYLWIDLFVGMRSIYLGVCDIRRR